VSIKLDSLERNSKRVTRAQLAANAVLQIELQLVLGPSQKNNRTIPIIFSREDMALTVVALDPVTPVTPLH
jgi:hypothetical protein